jgi:2-amino-4-hydroxy-6-hydroxymethyldihydropteridine diphosphokinase
MAAAAKPTGESEPSGEYRVVLGLGANLGEAMTTLREAARLLERQGLIVIEARSSVYRTPPAGGPAQPDYLNAAVLGATRLEPLDLLRGALAIERSLGRQRPDLVRWGPRTIDIDVLWISRGTHRSADLTVPHPRLAERPFAVRPLIELLPDAVDPQGRRYALTPAAREPIERLELL